MGGQSPQIRNIGFLAPLDAGKTTLTERILFLTGMCRRMGEVDRGTSVMDWMEQEQERGLSIASAATSTLWRNCRLNILDTPGHLDFEVEVARSLRVLDGVVSVFSAVEGVDPQAEFLWRRVDRHRVARVIVINKIDRADARFAAVLSDIATRLDARALPFHLPIGAGAGFSGIIDVLRQVALVWGEEDGPTSAPTERPIPEGMIAAAAEARRQIVTLLRSSDHGLAPGGGPPGPAELLEAARSAVRRRLLIPIFVASAFRCRGVRELLDAIVATLPAPEDLPPVWGQVPGGDEQSREPRDTAPLAALAFKVTNDPFVGSLTWLRVYSGQLDVGATVVNARTGRRERVGRLVRMYANKREDIERARAGDIVAAVGLRHTGTGETLCDPASPISLEPIQVPEALMTVALKPGSRLDAERQTAALHRLVSEDPSLRVEPQGGTTLLHGVGELHLEVACERLKREFKVAFSAGPLQVALGETVAAPGEGSGQFEREMGGRNQFAQVRLRVEPQPPGSGVTVVDMGLAERTSQEFARAAEEGVHLALEKGGASCYPMRDVRVALLDGSAHEGDSSEAAFKIAGSRALQDAVSKAEVTLLEPVMCVEVSTPEEYAEGVKTELIGRRGRVIRTEMRSFAEILTAEVPLAAMVGYASGLRAQTGGRASFGMHFARYAPVPAPLASEILTRARGR